jgi:hypothetical protein
MKKALDEAKVIFEKAPKSAKYLNDLTALSIRKFRSLLSSGNDHPTIAKFDRYGLASLLGPHGDAEGAMAAIGFVLLTVSARVVEALAAIRESVQREPPPS